MKFLMLSVASICILWGCNFSMGPLHGNSSGLGGGKSTYTPPYEYYSADILVIYEDGEPCTTAYASNITYAERGIWYVYAGTNGVISLESKLILDEDNPQVKMCTCSVFKQSEWDPDDGENIIWSGEIPLYRWDIADQYPDYVLELVIPINYDEI